jgi:hypothetical protein
MAARSLSEAGILRVVEQVGCVGIPMFAARGERPFEHRQRFARRARREDGHPQPLGSRLRPWFRDGSVADPPEDDTADAVPERDRQRHEQRGLCHVGRAKPPVKKAQNCDEAGTDEGAS